jgi:hypothetical protein
MKATINKIIILLLFINVVFLTDLKGQMKCGTKSPSQNQKNIIAN